MRLPMIIVLIAFSQHLCSGLDFAGIASGTLNFIKFLDENGVLRDKGPKAPNKILKYLESMNSNIESDLESVLSIVEKLPDFIDLYNKRDLLEQTFRHLGLAFATAVKDTRDINLNNTQDDTVYENHRGTYEVTIDGDLNTIYSVFLDSLSTPYITKNFTTNLKLVENICQTGLSDYQVLDNLLMSLKIATGQYFVTKNLFYDIGEYLTKRSFDSSREKLIKDTKDSYKNAVKKFKIMLSNASRTIWTCDKKSEYKDAVRYKNKPDSSFYELLAFQKYYVNEVKFEETCSSRCEFNNLYHKCPHMYTKGCTSTRMCPGKLINCKVLKEDTAVCINKDAINRYTSASPYTPRWLGIGGTNYSPGFVCPKDRVEKMEIRKDYGDFRFCSTCDCICQEKSYYISTTSAMADIHENKIVTGARLLMEDNTLYVQIQQGQLMPNGYIKKTTVQWKPIEKADEKNRVMITWDGMRTIALNGIKLEPDCVVAGLQMSYDSRDVSKKRMQLVTHGVTIDFNNGKINNDRQIYDSPPAYRELDMSNRDVPTKAKDNNQRTEGDEFVDFTITSLEKDGGQTTIPFIDTQILETNPPMPLSGAGLSHRGQEGYGGFIGLKLFVFDVAPHILRRHSFNSILKTKPITNTNFGK